MLKNLLRKININKDAKNVAKTYEMKLFVSCALFKFQLEDDVHLISRTNNHRTHEYINVS